MRKEQKTAEKNESVTGFEREKDEWVAIDLADQRA